MNNNEFYQILGQITYSFGRIDFLISNIAVDVGLAREYQQFYARTNFEKKIKSLKEGGKINITDKDILNNFLDLLNQLDSLRIIRNNLMHSIILENGSEILLYNFINNKKQAIKLSIKQYNLNGLRNINEAFLNLHNDIYELWQTKIKN